MTSPARSCTPSGLAPAGCCPTGQVLPLWMHARVRSSGRLPHGQVPPPSRARAAYIHSSSFGTRLPSQLQ
ncbi:hypothetical protein OV079_20170 [Nannocystis pusilla]|uniref:Uncharacterized protein n=1 Tax=Nannocystis pusilla TaxID=889268 RepID=A0A9X3IWW9_9BACT|nr:hypothetical protein [Nannocystis pusilla]MCY1007827.1 hypothetical protein [Nannocystis pusilla]